MSRVFADTHFYIAILSRRDAAHNAAMAALSSGRFDQMITTSGVLLEVADAMAGIPERERCAQFVATLRASDTTKIIPLTEELIERGLSLYSSRPDKEWSLTDCISFVAMTDEQLTEALSGDRHFLQAGFIALFGVR
jgi:hypothetical protein